MTLTFISLYNTITGQAWSMFDGDVEAQDEFELNVTTSIQKALSDLWNRYPYPFKAKTKVYKLKKDVREYPLPIGNIQEKNNKYRVRYESQYLTYNNKLDEVTYPKEGGEPQQFNVDNEKLVIYPQPDKNNYTLNVDYWALFPCKDKDGVQKATLENEDDYIDIPVKYEELFKNALITLAMTYLIASDTDENFSQYQAQYNTAYERLIKSIKRLDKERRITF